MLPDDPELLGGELVTVPFAERRVLTRYAVRTAPSLGSTPRGAFIAVVVDGSRSTPEGFSGAVRAAVDAYLSHFLDARVQVILFDRKTHSLYGRFTPVGRVRADLVGWNPQRQNGSDVDRALFEADRLLAGTLPHAPRRLLLVTDGLTRQGLTAERLRGATGASGAIVHLGLLSQGTPSLSRDDAHPWAAAARPSGGLLWRAAAGDGTVDEARHVFEEWARPLRLDHVQLFSPDLHLGEDEEPGAPLDEGESIERLLVTNRAASWIRIEGELWSRAVQTTLVANPLKNPLWAGLVFGSALLNELDEHEMMPLARLGGAVSPVTSYLAIEPGVRPSTEGLEASEGNAFGFGSAPPIRFGATAASGQMPPLDRTAFLRHALRSGLAQCGGAPGSASLSLETTNVEVVAVTVRASQPDPLVERCLEEVVWNLALPIQFTEPWQGSHGDPGGSARRARPSGEAHRAQAPARQDLVRPRSGENETVILVDTSAWIEFFRDRRPFAEAVDVLLDSGEAALCGPVVTEIRRGLRPSERARVLPLLEGCHLLSQPDDLWLSAGDLGALLARRGVTVKTLDLLIATYALAHGTPVLATDGDFRAMAKAKVGLSVAE